MPSRRIKSTRPLTVTGGGGTVTIEPFTDTLLIQINAADTQVPPTDNPTFVLNVATADTQAAPTTEDVSLGIQGLADTVSPPTDSRTALIRVWLSGSAGSGVTNPANADGVNDGALATVSTAVAGSTTEILTSAVGANVPSGITFSSAIYTGWFRAQTSLITSTAKILARSIGALFADITMFTQSTLNGDTNHLSGDFTFDLVAAGVNTLAKLQSLQIIHQTTDAAAGVTPAILTVDAGSVDIVVTSI